MLVARKRSISNGRMVVPKLKKKGKFLRYCVLEEAPKSSKKRKDSIKTGRTNMTRKNAVYGRPANTCGTTLRESYASTVAQHPSTRFSTKTSRRSRKNTLTSEIDFLVTQRFGIGLHLQKMKAGKLICGNSELELPKDCTAYEHALIMETRNRRRNGVHIHNKKVLMPLLFQYVVYSDIIIPSSTTIPAGCLDVIKEN